MTKGCGMGAVAIRAAGLVVFCWLLGAPLGARAAEPADLLGEVRMLRGQGDYAAAIRAYSQAFLQHPRPSELLVERGQTHVAAGNLAAANIDFTEAIRLDPQNAAAYKARAATTWDTGDAEAALEDYHEALRLRPNDAEAQLSLAAAYDYYRANHQVARIRLSDELRTAHRNTIDAMEAQLMRTALPLRPARLTVALCEGKYTIVDEAVTLARILQSLSDELSQNAGDEPMRALRAMLLRKLKKHSAAIDDLSFLIDAHPENALYYELRAGVYRERDELAKAIDDYTAALTRTPESARLLFERGQCHDGLDQIEKAVADMERVLALQADHAEAAGYLAWHHYQAGRLDQAETLVEIAVAGHPDHAMTRFLRGILLERKGDDQAAIDEFSAALSLDYHAPADVLVYRGFLFAGFNRLDKADADFAEAARLEPENIDAYKGRAAMAIARDDYSAAIHYIERALAIAPRDAEVNYLFNSAIDAVYGNLGLGFELDLPNLVGESQPGLQDAVSQRLLATIRRIAPGPIEAASIGNRYAILDQRVTLQSIADCLTEELKSNPIDADGRLVRALLYVKMDRDDLARTDLQELVNTHPEKLVYRILLAIYSLKVQPAKSIAQLDAILEASPDNIAAAYYRASCYQAQRKYEQALTLLDRVTATVPTSHAASAVRADCLFSLERWDEALTELNRAITLNDSYAETRFRRGYVLLRQSQFRLAIEDLSAALELGYKDQVVALECRALAYMSARGEWELAYADATRAIGLAPNSATLYKLRAGILELQNDLSAALQDAEMAARLAPDNEEYQEYRNRLSEQITRQKL